MLLKHWWQKQFRCPSCGNFDIRLFDVGLRRIYRLAILNPRFICASCKTSWRRRSPQHLVKVKRKQKANPDNPYANAFKRKQVPEGFWSMSDEELEQMVDGWRQDGWRRFCLDLSQQETLDLSKIGTLPRLYRTLKSAKNEFIIANASETIGDFLWSLGLGHLIIADQDIMD